MSICKNLWIVYPRSLPLVDPKASVRLIAGTSDEGLGLPHSPTTSRLQRGNIMDTLQVSAQNQLRQLIEQIERLEEEKKALAGDIRDKYAEADRQEEEAILATYLHALGMSEEMPERQVMDAAE